jgi:hypothetical protein
VCGHSQRSDVEAELADGTSLSSVAASYAVTRQSLRRHRSGHMHVSFTSDGIDPWTTVLRMSEAANRLKDLADDAEDRGRLADATRAVLAEARVLDLMLALGVQGASQLDYAADAAAMEKAVTTLVRQVPSIGDQLAELLSQQERDAFAAKLRAFAEKCRALQVSQNKEIPA